ncbi:hypothetical protein NFHSH190041_16690 [Shewanella sp. NFH-SH190041]|uniref:CAP domain-containing protein n=1 Tax=Shewanella sp. NFH-SH190041 TaxID=2950245 RepID=UPI0021C476B4|nr:CAP domain-containing protein [Shewanella sp. NFH-SH190041]BDM64217.1 hypothetical protein NFHSH190041_16690 [Shewanella sp. NFH-SH190041]
MKKIALILCCISLAGCDQSSTTENHQTKIETVKPTQNHLEHLLMAFKGVANGANFNRGNQNAIPLHPEQLYPLSGDYSEQTIPRRGPVTVWLNDTRLANNWHCYAVTHETQITRDVNGMTVNGEVQEYAYRFSHSDCGGPQLAKYTFDNALINDQLQIASGTISVSEQGRSHLLLQQALLQSRFNNQNTALFGPAWAELQAPYLAQAMHDDADLFDFNPATNVVTVKATTTTDAVIPYSCLNKDTLLAGQAFDGSTDSGIASTNWCRIVNIPHDTADSQKYQAVIAMNCARSTPRWCDAAGDMFAAGISPATHTLAWNDALTVGAQRNSQAMEDRHKQGHFVVENWAQNAFRIRLNNAIDPIFGYTHPRADGHINNAGANSWTGHAGHCQNVMSPRMHSFAVTWLPQEGSPVRSNWTEDFR